MIVATPTPFVLHVRDDEHAGAATATFDAQGRLLSFRLNGDHYRRGLDGAVVRLVRPVRDGETPAAAWAVVREPDPESILVRVRSSLPDLVASASSERAALLAARARAGLADLWRADAAVFARVLGCVPIVPPLHVRSVVLRLTEGCAYGGCRFCTLYETLPFRVRTADEWAAHVAEVLDWFGDGAGARPHLWVGDASLLEAGHDRLIDALDTLGRAVTLVPEGDPERRLRSDPRAFTGIHGFADVPRAAALPPGHARALAARGVRRLHLGLESGHPPLLRMLRKPHRGAQIHAAVERLHVGGIGVGLVVLVGAGGRALAEAHHDDTVELIASLPLGTGDLVQVSPLDAFARRSAAAGDDPLDDAELARATRTLTEALEEAVAPGARVADYGLEGFVY